jgi:hypothetical protein
MLAIARFTDAVKQLKITDYTEHTADYGSLPDLSKTNKDSDILVRHS